MIRQKTKAAAAVFLAVLFAFLLFGISFVMFPSSSQQPPRPGPKPEPGYLLGEVSWAILLISIAVLVAVSIVVAVPILKRKKEMLSTVEFFSLRVNELDLFI